MEFENNGVQWKVYFVSENTRKLVRSVRIASSNNDKEEEVENDSLLASFCGYDYEELVVAYQITFVPENYTEALSYHNNGVTTQFIYIIRNNKYGMFEINKDDSLGHY